MGFKLTSLNLNLPFGLGGVSFTPTEEEAKAAWKLYVELSTRVAIVKLEPGTGSIRESLDSLYSLFDITRDILKEGGPSLGKDANSLGPLATRVLNHGLRPFVVKWHTEFRKFEVEAGKVDSDAMPVHLALEERIDESKWKLRDQFYKELEENRQKLKGYLTVLAQIVGMENAEELDFDK